MEGSEVLREIASQIACCEKCALHYSRKHSVPGEGPAQARILFIGEGPGFNENEVGRPFVGQAGKFLDELLVQAGLTRDEVFITNVVKCRPPGNRDPLPEELAACAKFLDWQIDVLQPEVIVTLGRYSMVRYLPNARISDVHGQPAWIENRLIIPMFHPAAALHQPSLKSALIADFENLPNTIAQAGDKRVSMHEETEGTERKSTTEATEQLSLF